MLKVQVADLYHDALASEATMDVRSYAKRLDLELCRGPSVKRLRMLHERHLLSIPFENLDIHRGVRIILDEQRILEKIVKQRRGGFCYELNSGFHWLLTELGYSVTLLSAEVARKEGGFGVAFDHLVLRVDLDQPFLADVGFGDSFRYPLPLVTDRVEEQLGDRFRLVRAGPWWILERWRRDEADFCPQYRFTLEPRRLSDFAPGCHYHQSSPRSSFTRGPICTVALPDGRLTLHAEKLVTIRGDRREEVPIRTEREWLEVLEERFGIVI